MSFEDEGDGYDDFIKAGSRQTPDEEFVASGRKLRRVNRTGPGSPVKGPPIKKLEDQRWADHLGHNERRDVLLSAKAGDPAAKERLAKSYQKALIKIAGKAKYNGPPFDERLGAAWVGFWRAFKGWDPDRNNGFWAYAAKFVRGAVCDCVTNWHNRGGKAESRAVRKDRSEHRPVHVQYNGVEGSHYDLGGREAISEAIGGWIAEDDKREWDESGTRIRLSKRLANLGRRLGVPREHIGIDEDPRRNGGRRLPKARMVLVSSTGWKFDGIPRGEGNVEQLPLHEYLKQNPTPERHLVRADSIRGSGSPLGIIGYLAPRRRPTGAAPSQTCWARAIRARTCHQGPRRHRSSIYDTASNYLQHVSEFSRRDLRARIKQTKT
jgi:hypothetical protein